MFFIELLDKDGDLMLIDVTDISSVYLDSDGDRCISVKSSETVHFAEEGILEIKERILRANMMMVEHFQARNVVRGRL